MAAHSSSTSMDMTSICEVATTSLQKCRWPGPIRVPTSKSQRMLSLPSLIWFGFGEEDSSKKMNSTKQWMRLAYWSGTIWCLRAHFTLPPNRFSAVLRRRWGTTLKELDIILQWVYGMVTIKYGLGGWSGVGKGGSQLLKNSWSKRCTMMCFRSFSLKC